MRIFRDRQIRVAFRFYEISSETLRVTCHYRHGILRAILVPAAILMAIAVLRGQQLSFIPNGVLFPNPGGASQTYSAINGGIDLTGPFFQSMGTNGRSCATCHQLSDGMSVSAENVQRRFVQTKGLDPIFRVVDGSNCDHSMDVSTVEGRYQAYSLLRTRGLLPIALAVPPNADYQAFRVINPYGCNEKDVISVYRRPFPA